MGEWKGDEMIERAYLENKAFDVLLPWRQFHPRTFWQMVDAVADLLAEAPKPEVRFGEYANGTSTESICSVELN